MSKKKLIAYPMTSFILGHVLGTFLPAPTDLIHFGVVLPWLQANINNPAARFQVAAVSVFDWYVLDTLWYLALLVLAIELKPSTRAFVILLSLGIAIGLVAQFIFSGSFLPRPGG